MSLEPAELRPSARPAAASRWTRLRQGLTASELSLLLDSRTVQSATVRQVRDGRYHLYVGGAGCAQPLVLLTRRATPRQWSRLDTLASQLKRCFGGLSTLVVIPSAVAETAATTRSAARCAAPGLLERQ